MKGIRKTLLLFVVFVLLGFGAFAEGESDDDFEVTTITINNARETNYSKDPESDNDIITLEGSVELSVEKGDIFSEIKADKINYDRVTEMLYAEGNVVINTKSSSSGGETSSANSLLLNTATLEGVFDGGKVVQTKSDALNLPSGSTLIVFSDAFGKGNSNVIAFRNSKLTFCEDENPHWHIDATRTWLLPGGEFAFFNALLYVGVLPVLYFPAFYYPKDELIFNPVFSIRKREGYSVQTTTYLHGRKGLEQSDSKKSSGNKEDDDKISSEALYNFMKPTSLKEQRREGLMLHNLDSDFKGDTSEYLKLLADYYSNLGFFIGIDGKYRPSPKYITDLSFFFNLGFSNTLFQKDGKYYPFSSSGKSYRDYSAFLGIKLPFRYAANIKFTLSKPFRLSVSLPIYSDPFFNYDFKNNRSESMDWISYFLDNDENENNKNDNKEISSFVWSLSASYNPSLPKFLNPFISSISTSLNTSVNFTSRDTNSNNLTYEGFDIAETDWKSNTPLRKFYYPSSVKPVSIGLSLSGKLLNYPSVKSNGSSNVPAYPISLNKPDELKSKKDIEKEQAEAKKQEQSEKNEKENKDTEDKKTDTDIEKTEDKQFSYYFPELEVPAVPVAQLPGVSYNLGYSLKTDFATQINYSSSNLLKPEDFDWKNIQSFMYTLKIPVTLSSNLSYRQNFFTMENKLSYNPLFQRHPFISNDEKNGGYSVESANNIILADYKSERQDIINHNYLSLKPFIYVDMLKDTRISWTSNLKLFENEFKGTIDNPLWEPKFFDIKDKKSFTENALSLNLSFSEMENLFSQNLIFSCIMPPLLNQYSIKLDLKFPFVRTSLETGFYETSNDNVSAEDKWKKKPLAQNLSLSLFNSSLSFSESFSYSLEEKKAERLNLSASWKGLNVSFFMSDTYGYDFEKNTGWTMRKEKEFLPSSLSFSYSTPNKTFKTLFDKIQFTPGLSTSIVTDLLRPTNSYFLFTPSVSFLITDFLTLKFSSTSKNSILYWYFNNNPGDLYSDWGGFPGNILKDLIDSFRFDDNSIREKSGFKLKSLNLDLEHDLHDWKLNMSLKVEPRIIRDDGKPPHYDFSPYFSIGIVWKPMDSLKTEIIDEYGKWNIK